jgi:hypothetical protein
MGKIMAVPITLREVKLGGEIRLQSAEIKLVKSVKENPSLEY